MAQLHPTAGQTKCSCQNVYFRVYVKVNVTCTLHKCVCGGRLTLNYLDILWGDSRWNISLWNASISFRSTHGEFSGYLAGFLMVICLDILSGVTFWILYTFFGRLTVSSVILLDILRWIISIFWGHRTIKYVDILSDDTRWIMWIFCRTPHVELSRYCVWRPTVNTLDILRMSDSKLHLHFSKVSLWIISTFCRKLAVDFLVVACEVSRWLCLIIFECLTVNYLNFLSSVSHWISPIFCRQY